MIDPHEYCPRCGKSYIKGGKSDPYLHLICSGGCNFLYFIDSLTMRRFTYILRINDTTYRVVWVKPWYYDGKNKTHISSSIDSDIIIDGWLPLDISDETIKMYIVFQ